jgi:hypothetical protein
VALKALGSSPRIVVGVLLSVVAVSCDPYVGLGSQAIGVSRAPGGHVLLRWVPCRGEVLERVRLFLVVGDDPAVGDEDDRVLWEIVAIEGAQPTPSRILVGDTRPGFEETKPLKVPIRPGKPYVIFIDSNFARGLDAVEFDLASLRADRIFSMDAYYTETEFRERGMEKCATPPARNS